MAELPQMMRAFGVTFLSMFRKVTTEQYPEEKVPDAGKEPGTLKWKGLRQPLCRTPFCSGLCQLRFIEKLTGKFRKSPIQRNIV